MEKLRVSHASNSKYLNAMIPHLKSNKEMLSDATTLAAEYERLDPTFSGFGQYMGIVIIANICATKAFDQLEAVKSFIVEALDVEVKSLPVEVVKKMNAAVASFTPAAAVEESSAPTPPPDHTATIVAKPSNPGPTKSLKRKKSS